MICTKIIIRSNSEAATGNIAGVRAAAGGFMKKGFLANIGKSAMINATPLGKGMDRTYSGYQQAQAAKKMKTVTMFKDEQK